MFGQWNGIFGMVLVFLNQSRNNRSKQSPFASRNNHRFKQLLPIVSKTQADLTSNMLKAARRHARARPGAPGDAECGTLISPWGGGRGALVSAPKRPCQPWSQVPPERRQCVPRPLRVRLLPAARLGVTRASNPTAPDFLGRSDVVGMMPRTRRPPSCLP